MLPTESRINRAKKFLIHSPIKPRSRWVEFGAGYGTYILALHQINRNVMIVALELDLKRLYFLNELIETQNLNNVQLLRSDFFNPSLRAMTFDGVLLANVLHFSPNPYELINEARHILKNKGSILIVEYSVTAPLPWVPYPLPKQKIVKLLKAAPFQDINLLAEDNRAYSITAKKL